MSSPDPLRRFTDRVEDYVRYRPNYPAALLQFLGERAGLSQASRLADVGSGTGIFTAQLLELVGEVWAVEPNAAMRAAAEVQLGSRAGFHSVAGTSEATGLPDHAVAAVTCAQAFHWFKPAETRREFQRILVPGGWCALVWNTSKQDGSPFAAGYERIKADFGTDFGAIRHEDIPTARFAAFFGPGGWEKSVFAHAQTFDLPGLKGRLLSSSYASKAGHPRHLPMIAAVEALFARCQEGGLVRMNYDTELLLGRFI